MPMNTYGWDLVIAARTSALNRRSTGPSASLDAEVAHENGPVHATGELGAWKIARGGSGRLVRFAVPCGELTLSQGDRSFTFRDGTAVIEAGLKLVPPASGADPDRRDLVVEAGPGAVVALSAQFDDPSFAGFEVLAVAAVQAWLDAQASLPYRLAGLDLAPISDGGGHAALVPAEASYAYCDTADADGALALLCTVAASRGGTAGLLQELDPAVLGSGDAAVLLGGGVTQRLLDLALRQATWLDAGRSTATVGTLAFPANLTWGNG